MRDYEVLIETINPCGGEAHAKQEFLEIQAESPEFGYDPSELFGADPGDRGVRRDNALFHRFHDFELAGGRRSIQPEIRRKRVHRFRRISEQKIARMIDDLHHGEQDDELQHERDHRKQGVIMRFFINFGLSVRDRIEIALHLRL